MKTSIISILLLVTCNLVFCQVKIDKYCEVVIKNQVFSSKYKVDKVEYGQTNYLFSYKDITVSQVLDWRIC